MLIDTTTAPGLIAGGLAAVLAAGAYQAAYIESAENTAIRARLLLGAWHAIVAEPFTTGSGDAYDLGHRALTAALLSLEPATIVIGIDPEADRLLVHRAITDERAGQARPRALAAL